MSEPVQTNQSAPVGTDPQAVSDAVAAADAAVPAADLDAALAEVDKMQESGPTEAAAVVATNANGTPTPSAAEPSQAELDAIAQQVESTVFGEGTPTGAAPDVTTPQATPPQQPEPIVLPPNFNVPPTPDAKPVTPAPPLPSFLPSTAVDVVPPIPSQPSPSVSSNSTPPVAVNPSGASPLAQTPVGSSSLGAGGYAGVPSQPGQMAYVPTAQFGQPGQPNQPTQLAQFGQGQSWGQPLAYAQNQGMSGLPPMAQAGAYPANLGGNPAFGGANPSNSMPGYGYTNSQAPSWQSPQSLNTSMGGGYGQSPQMGMAGQNQPMMVGQLPGQPNTMTAFAPPSGMPGAGLPAMGSVATAQFSSATMVPAQNSAPAPVSVPPATSAPPTPPNVAQPTAGHVPGSPEPTPPPTTPNANPPAPPESSKPAGSISSGVYSNMIDVLTDMQVLSADQLTQLKQEFLTTGRNYEDILAANKWLSEENLTKARAKLNNVPYITLGEVGISPEALSKLDESVARRYGILPFAIDKVDHKLSVAMKNPLDIQAIGFAEQKTGFHLVVHYASPSEVERLITERYAQNLSTEVDEALKDTEQSKVRHKEQDNQLNDFGGVIRDAPINRIVETILEFAVKSRASDVHIEPLPNKVRVRYRIDGILVEKLVLPRSVIDAVVSRIKILGNMKIDEKRIPQDGRFNYTNDVKNVDLRVSTIPTVNGEKVNMRLLEKNLNVPTLEQLGLDGLSLANVKEAIKVPHGIILISGPTGSGKTTTLYALLNILNTPKVNIVTLEDPVEYQMLGVNQVQINPKAGLTFATGLRAFLRQDPNIVMVGEMRDSETTGLAIQASLTGHLVFSTIHTSSAATALPRMTDMGAENFLIASSVTLIMAQRVVRKINPSYREEYTPDPAVVADIARVLGPHFDNWLIQHGKTPQTLTLFRPSANRPENEPEYLGRVAIYEVLRMTEVIGRMVLQNRPASEIEQEALRNGMLLMKQDGYMKALNGITTIEEVLRVAEV